MQLHEIEIAIRDAEQQIEDVRLGAEEAVGALQDRIERLKLRRELSITSINQQKVQLAESFLEIQGQPYMELMDLEDTLVERAYQDLATGGELLKRNRMAVVKQGNNYLRLDHAYDAELEPDMEVNAVGLQANYRTVDLGNDMKDAGMYYLANLRLITALRQAQAQSGRT